MTIRDIFSKLWPGKGSAEKQLKLLVKQIDSASEDLKIRIAESIASSAGLERKLEQCNKLSDSQKPRDERQEMLRQAIQAEKRLLEGLHTLFSELKNRSEEINIALEQNLLRQRKAASDELLTAAYRDFGSDLKLNYYLEKFSNETLKIEYTAESNLRIELLNKQSGQ